MRNAYVDRMAAQRARMLTIAFARRDGRNLGEWWTSRPLHRFLQTNELALLNQGTAVLRRWVPVSNRACRKAVARINAEQREGMAEAERILAKLEATP